MKNVATNPSIVNELEQRTVNMVSTCTVALTTAMDFSISLSGSEESSFSFFFLLSFRRFPPTLRGVVLGTDEEELVDLAESGGDFCFWALSIKIS